MRKVISLVLMIVMISSIFITGCGKKNDESSSTATVAPTEAVTAAVTASVTEAPTVPVEHVKLKMYFLGDAPKDLNKVWDEINKKLTEKINAEIEPVILGWGDYAEKYPLLFASGEEWDMIYTASWCYYGQQAAKGGFYEITPEFFTKNMPLSDVNLNKAALATTKVNGKSYMIPGNQAGALDIQVGIRGDLREKYGIAEIKTVADLEAYFDAIIANEPNMVPLADIASDNEQTARLLSFFPNEYWKAVDGVGTLFYNYGDNTKLTTLDYFDIPGFKEYMQKMVDWRKKGYWSRSALTTNGKDENFLNGKGAAVILNQGSINADFDTLQDSHPDWKVECYTLQPEGKKWPTNGYIGNGAAIHATSANPERAAMALDLLAWDPEINYLVVNGIPGYHTNNVGTQERQVIEWLVNDYGGGYSQWCFVNYTLWPIIKLDNFDAMFESILSNTASHYAAGLSFNADNVKTEIASVTQVIAQYEPIMFLGFTDDVDKTLADFKQALKDAGNDKINAEIQAQLQAQFDAAQ